jgi:hypothetical protein
LFSSSLYQFSKNDTQGESSQREAEKKDKQLDDQDEAQKGLSTTIGVNVILIGFVSLVHTRFRRASDPLLIRGLTAPNHLTQFLQSFIKHRIARNNLHPINFVDCYFVVSRPTPAIILSSKTSVDFTPG